MNLREKSKIDTREKILAAAKAGFIENGLLSISTLDIAKIADVAHGTLFFHFQNKENLMLAVLDEELLKLTLDLNTLLGSLNTFEEILSSYLDFLSQEEEIFSAIAIETPLYPPPLRRIILGREAAIRSYFYQALEIEIGNGKYKDIEITTFLNMLFGSINYYLSFRDSFINGESVIQENKDNILQTTIQILRE